MTICFIGSTQNITSAIDDFRAIVKTIHEQGHVLSRDWLEPTYAAAKNKLQDDSIDWEDVYKRNIEGISQSDLVIAEASYDSLGTGFMLAVAIQSKKPILILTKEGSKQGVILKGLHGAFIVKASYTPNSLSTTIKKFIKDNTVEHKDLRFNFYLDPHQFAYLDWKSHQTGKAKSEIVRDLIDKDLSA